jgi:1-phosphatidylinositol-4-phosphate 5-kinase
MAFVDGVGRGSASAPADSVTQAQTPAGERDRTRSDVSELLAESKRVLETGRNKLARESATLGTTEGQPLVGVFEEDGGPTRARGVPAAAAKPVEGRKSQRKHDIADEFARFLLLKGFQSQHLERVGDNLTELAKHLVMGPGNEQLKDPKFLIEGWLQRQNGRSLKKLFCAVECGNFKYYANEGDTRPKGVLTLSLGEGASAQEHEVVSSTFILATGNGKKREETQWVAPSAEVCARWVACISAAIMGFPDKAIGDDHHCHELTADMMHGMRTMIGKNSQKDSQLLSVSPQEKDFTEVVSQEFPSKGSNRTPPHRMADFGFKDYCPTIFRRIRARFGISPEDYLMDVCGNFGYLEFVSNSKSGEFFFHSHNRKYMIKTISHNECRGLRTHMSTYYRHMMSNPNTLVNKFFGLHKVKPSHGNSRFCWFLIMGSVFPSTLPMHLIFDLKGATRNRTVKPSEQGQPGTVYKDNDFTNQKISFDVGSLSDALKLQLTKDTKLLETLKIIDYSVLCGIHFFGRESPSDGRGSGEKARPRESTQGQLTAPGTANKEQRAAQFQSSLAKLVNHVQDMTPKDLLKMSEEEFEVAAGHDGKGFYGLLHGTGYDGASKIDPPSPAVESKSPRRYDFKPLESKMNVEVAEPSIFASDRGGLPAVIGPTGEQGLIFIGIIDTLIEFGSKKKMESFYKAQILRVDKKAFSVVEPEYYADRLRTFVNAKITDGQKKLPQEVLQ